MISLFEDSASLSFSSVFTKFLQDFFDHSSVLKFSISVEWSLWHCYPAIQYMQIVKYDTTLYALSIVVSMIALFCSYCCFPVRQCKSFIQLWMFTKFLQDFFEHSFVLDFFPFLWDEAFDFVKQPFWSPADWNFTWSHFCHHQKVWITGLKIATLKSMPRIFMHTR